MFAFARDFFAGRSKAANKAEQKQAERVGALPAPLRALVDGASMTVREPSSDDGEPRLIVMAEPAGMWQWRDREATAKRLAQALPGFDAVHYQSAAKALEVLCNAAVRSQGTPSEIAAGMTPRAPRSWALDY